jgi:hypothetical protein
MFMSPVQSETQTRRRRSRAKAGSARNGAVRVTCFVSPTQAEAISSVCIELGITRGELLASAAERQDKRGAK